MRSFTYPCFFLRFFIVLVTLASLQSGYAGQAAPRGSAARRNARADPKQKAKALQAVLDAEEAVLRGEDSADLSPANMNLEQLRRFQAFHYVQGGRDPMLVRMAPKNIVPETPTVRKTNDVRPSDVDQEHALRVVLSNANSAISTLNFQYASTLIKNTQETVEKIWKGVTPGNQTLERLLREVRETGDMAEWEVRKQTVKDEFTGINIAIDGIQWDPVNVTSAIIDGLRMEVGQQLGRELPKSEVRLESVSPTFVRFSYKGFLFDVEPSQSPKGSEDRKDAKTGGASVNKAGNSEGNFFIPGFSQKPEQEDGNMGVATRP